MEVLLREKTTLFALYMVQLEVGKSIYNYIRTHIIIIIDIVLIFVILWRHYFNLCFEFWGLLRWSVIASKLPGRTDNDVKNYWNTKLKKKLVAGNTSNTNNIATRDTADINLEMFSGLVPKTETPHDQEFSSFFDGTLPYVMDVSLRQSYDHPKQDFDSCSQFPHSNPVELVNDFGFGTSTAHEVSSLIPSSSVSGSENNYNMWSANEGVNNDSGVLMDFGFEPPADVLLDGFGF